MYNRLTDQSSVCLFYSEMSFSQHVFEISCHSGILILYWPQLSFWWHCSTLDFLPVLLPALLPESVGDQCLLFLNFFKVSWTSHVTTVLNGCSINFHLSAGLGSHRIDRDKGSAQEQSIRKGRLRPKDKRCYRVNTPAISLTFICAGCESLFQQVVRKSKCIV